MGGRGASGGIAGTGRVVISKEQTPGGIAYFMTGKRNVLSNWDDDDNYHEKPIIIQERFSASFSSLEEAKKYAKKNKMKFIVV